MRKFLYTVLIILPILTFAQLGVSTTPFPAGCTGNGSVTVVVNGTTNNYNYEIVLSKVGGSDTDPNDNKDESLVASGNSISTSITSLNAGSWTIKVFETTENGSNTNVTVESAFTINDNYEATSITYKKQKNCGFEDIVIITQSGTPISYRLLSSVNGSVVRDTQTNKTFELVEPGDYFIEVTDQCNETNVYGPVTVDDIPSNYHIRRPGDNYNSKPIHGFNLIKGCNANGSRVVEHNIQFIINGSYATRENSKDRFPLTIKYEIKDDIGANLDTYTYVYNTFNEYKSNGFVDLTIPSGSKSVLATLKDKCNNTSVQNHVIRTEKKINIRERNAECGGKYFAINNYEGISLPTTFKFNSYPTGFIPSNFQLSNDIIVDDTLMTITFTTKDALKYYYFGDQSNPLPDGDYNITITDECGFFDEKTLTVKSNLTFNVVTLPSCEDGKMSVKLTLSGSEQSQTRAGYITHAEIISGPDANLTYPYDLTPYINDGRIYLNSFKPTEVGDQPYVITTGSSSDPNLIGTSCGVNVTRTFETYVFNKNKITKINVKNISVTPGCNSFRYNFTLDDLHNYSTSAFLQKYNSVLGAWKIASNSVYNVKKDIEYSLEIDSQNASAGEFRLVFKTSVFNHLDKLTSCEHVRENFDYEGSIIKINDYFVTQCAGINNDNYDLLIDAIGPVPLNYKILSKDGDNSFGTAYQESPVFLGITKGKYQIKVKDNCGSTRIAIFNVSKVKKPKIIADLCEGEYGTLKTSGLSRFNTMWYKNGQLISTDVTSDNVLVFSVFQENNDIGTYVAKIMYTGANNCGPINTLPYTVNSSTDDNPSSGNIINPNNNIGSNGVIDNNNDGFTNLFNYIQNFDNYGRWSEVPNANGNISNALVGDEWQYKFVTSGTYTFKHTVKGTCEGSNETVLTINYIAPCDRPFNELEPNEFSKVGISNLNKHISEDWPHGVANGFIVLESNTKGFTITRISNPESNIIDPKEGMLVFDTDENPDGCFKLYNGTTWKCIIKCGQ